MALKGLSRAISYWLHQKQARQEDEPNQCIEEDEDATYGMCIGDDEHCQDTGEEEHNRQIDYIVIHRITVEEAAGLPDDRIGLTEFFTNHPDGIAATGGQFPYHFLVLEDGDIEQMEPTDVVTPHVARWNKVAIGIGVVGDFRKKQLGDIQKYTLFQLCCSLLERFPDATLVGHGQLKGGSRHPNKVCPGSGINVLALGEAAAAYMRIS